MVAGFLDGLRVVTTALNVPGPAACRRLADLGASVTKVEPPGGDPLETYSPSWYGRLHEGMTIHRLDLKQSGGREAMAPLLEAADILVTAQRASALLRLGLDAKSLVRFPRLCHVAITGHAPPDDEKPGHDLTYLAEHGLVTPPVLPATLYSDMAGSERAVSTALALVIARGRDGRARAETVPLAEAARALAMPRTEGLTGPGTILGGGRAGYNLYAVKDGWIAVAALEPHFESRLAQSLGLDTPTTAALAAVFQAETARHWEGWARSHDLPIVAVRQSPRE
jgi:crotonobetainyl-CoA:carnitine CoA-transferase CaiB-like acyl-CoA transferase